MPRTGTAHTYTLTQPITSTNVRREGRTVAQMATLLFLANREVRGEGGGTQAEIIELTGLSPRTVGTAVRKLVEEGAIK